jgi:signal transduction histidine kinase
MKLRISITDNGVGFRTEIETEGRHIGLANVKERLLIAYAQASLEIESRPGGGACVAMEIVEQDGRL